jgi:hypothetical protein
VELLEAGAETRNKRVVKIQVAGGLRMRKYQFETHIDRSEQAGDGERNASEPAWWLAANHSKAPITQKSKPTLEAKHEMHVCTDSSAIMREQRKETQTKAREPAATGTRRLRSGYTPR